MIKSNYWEWILWYINIKINKQYHFESPTMYMREVMGALSCCVEKFSIFQDIIRLEGSFIMDRESRLALRSWTKTSVPNTQQSLTRYPLRRKLKDWRDRNLSKPHSILMSWNLLIVPSASTRYIAYYKSINKQNKFPNNFPNCCGVFLWLMYNKCDVNGGTCVSDVTLITIYHFNKL